MSILSTNRKLIKVGQDYSAGSGISIDDHVISVTGEFGKTYSAGDNISIYEQGEQLYISSKDWTNDIANASANAYNEAVAKIPDPFDHSYISGQVDNKLDTTAFTNWQNGQYSTDLQTIEGQINNKLNESAFSQVSGNFLTAINIPESAVWQDVSTTVQTNSAQWGQGGTGGDPEVNSFVYDNSATINEVNTTYQSNSSNYITAHQSLSNYVSRDDKSVAIGFNNTATDYSFAQGNNNSAVEVSFAQGYKNSANYYSFAQGEENEAHIYSFAQGFYNKAIIADSFALGQQNSAISNSFAQGIKNSAYDASLAHGAFNTAYLESIAQGRNNSASNRSQAFGYNTKATNSGMAIGTYNKTDSAAFVVGNGTLDNRSDSFIIYHDGSVSAAGKISANGVELGAGGGTLTGEFVPQSAFDELKTSYDALSSLFATYSGQWLLPNEGV